MLSLLTLSLFTSICEAKQDDAPIFIDQYGVLATEPLLLKSNTKFAKLTSGEQAKVVEIENAFYGLPASVFSGEYTSSGFAIQRRQFLDRISKLPLNSEFKPVFLMATLARGLDDDAFQIIKTWDLNWGASKQFASYIPSASNPTLACVLTVVIGQNLLANISAEDQTLKSTAKVSFERFKKWTDYFRTRSDGNINCGSGFKFSSEFLPNAQTQGTPEVTLERQNLYRLMIMNLERSYMPLVLGKQVPKLCPKSIDENKIDPQLKGYSASLDSSPASSETKIDILNSLRHSLETPLSLGEERLIIEIIGQEYLCVRIRRLDVSTEPVDSLIESIGKAMN